MTASEVASQYLGSSFNSLSEWDLGEIQRRMDDRKKSKIITIALHFILPYFGPLFYLNRWRTIILLIIGGAVIALSLPAIIAGLENTSLPMESLSVYLLVSIIPLSIISFFTWFLGFFYFNSHVDRVNREMSESIIDEFIAWRVASDTDE